MWLWICTWSDSKFNTSQLDFGNGSALWYFHHSDISGFYFLSNCTAWCVLRGFHENDESLISTMLQLWGNMEIHFEPVHSWVDWNNRNRKQKQGARVKMAIRNSTVVKIPTHYEKESLQLKSLIPSMCVTYCSTSILLWSSSWCQNFQNSGICFIQHTAAIISVGIICWLAVIIYNPFIQRGYTNAYLFPRIKSL